MMRMLRLIVWVGIFINLFSVGGVRAGEYLVGEGDVLEIRVFEEDDLGRVVRIAPDGTITLPLIGKLKVAGLSTGQTNELITEALKKDYLVNPQVTVHIQEYRSQRVEVLGAVKTPGVVYLTGRADLIFLLAQAGGVTETAGRFLMLSRAGEVSSGKDLELVPVDLKALLSEGKSELNVSVKGGDKIFVPQSNEIYVMGEVNKQGSVPFEDNLSLLQAISKVGGFTAAAAPSKVQIIRVVDGKEQVFRVDVKRIQEGQARDVPLMPEDIVTVSRSIF